MGVTLRSKKKQLDFEVNLIPFIDLLSACICFLLLSAVWIQVGSLNVKQAVGGQSAAETVKVPALWAQMQDNGNVILKFQDFPNSVVKQIGQQALVKSVEDGKINYEELTAKVAALVAVVPDLKTGLVMPRGESEYESVIFLMDHLKKQGLTNLGVSPL